MRTLCIADIHGGYKALKQCLERSKFNYTKDKLISLGDECDGWGETKKVIEELLKIKNLVVCLGNHSKWFLDFTKWQEIPEIWTSQGGRATLKSYGYRTRDLMEIHSGLRVDFIPFAHKMFFENALLYYLDEKNRLFVHGGIPEKTDVKDVDKDTLLWDRELFYKVISLDKIKTSYSEIYIGHTSTTSISDTPFCSLDKKVWCMDTGGGWEGKLSLIDIDTKEIWQSDVVKTLYKEHNGRNL